MIFDIFDQYFKDDEHRKMAIACYLGLCTFTDENVGSILATLDKTGLSEKTRVIFFSDHGDNMGARGIWGKSTMHEESAGIPMIIKGPDIPKSKKVKTPVSLVDIFPTVIDNLRLKNNINDNNLPGKSLIKIANDNDDYERIVLSEYHAAASPVGAFMLRRGKFKYVYFAEGYPPQLFNLEDDKYEEKDLSKDKNYEDIINGFFNELLKICDPEKVNKRAKKEQLEKIEKNGGIENILSRGDFGYSPAPGQKKEFD